jgi:hypothetical protein
LAAEAEKIEMNVIKTIRRNRLMKFTLKVYLYK